MNDAIDVGAGYSKEDRIWSVLCHLSTFITWFFLANIFVPLTIWLLKRDQLPLVREQGKEVLNFQITMVLYYTIAIVLIPLVIGIPLLICLPIYHTIVTIIAAIKVYDGVPFKYPMTLRLI